jgi:hypothetical protein
MLAQLGICDFEGIRPATTQRGEQVKFLQFFDRGGVIVYYARGGAGMGALCFAVNNIVTFQLTSNIYFFEPRPSKTGRGEGGLLCVEN